MTVPPSAVVERVPEWVARAVYREAVEGNDESTAVDTSDDEVVVVPAVTVPSYFAEEVASAREALTEAAGKAEEIYRDLLPHAAKVYDANSDGIVRAFDDATGWHALWSDVVNLAGGLMVAVGAGSREMTHLFRPEHLPALGLRVEGWCA